MDNSSLAAKAVASSPAVTAPAAFNGQEWLIVANLWAMTMGFLIGAIVIATLLSDAHRHRHREMPGLSPARLWRLMGLLFSTGIMLRCGAEALTLWGWDLAQPVKTGAFLYIKRLIDPVAVACGVTGLIVFIMSLPGILHQLRREPIPLDIWQTWPIVRRMIALAIIAGVAAFGVTVTR